ncbi:MAG: flavin reductase family protein [Rhodospirillales bacterium]|nr:flavin reductase family protein [Rhodospirillales bacterium]
MPSSNVSERDFRDAMGSFTTGVCVLGAKRRDGFSIGMTVNSFTSVSLKPPLILICLGLESPRSRAVIDSGRFSVSMLAEDQRDLSGHFARPGEGLVPATGWREGLNGAPVMESAAAIIECAIETTYTAGDHLIVIGLVTHVESDPGREPLVYFRGGYRLLNGEAG